jgi:hypothetical protein
LRRGRSGCEALVRVATRTIGALIIGWTVAFAIWPWLQTSNPLARLVGALKFFAKVDLNFSFPSWGRVVGSQALPWHYSLGEMLARLSELFLILLFVALILGAAWWFGFVRACVRRARLRGLGGLRAPALLLARSRGLVIVAMATLTPFLIILVTKPTLYDGFRHLMFVMALLALLAGWAVWRLSPLIRQFPIVAALIGGVQVGLAVATMATLHPLEYIETNVFAGRTQGSYGRFALDYWSEAATIAVRRLEERLEYDQTGRNVRSPRVMVCIPWREYLAGALFRQRWIVETDPKKADYVIETERGVCAQGEGTVIDEVRRYGRVFARTIDMHGR